MTPQDKPPKTEKPPIQATVTIINPKESTDSSQGGKPKWLETTETIVSSFKIVAWPLVILILLLFLWHPIADTFAKLPDLVSSSTKITIGSFSMEMDRVAKIIGNESLGRLMGGLSTRSIELLIETGNARYHFVGTQMGPTGDMIVLPNELDIEALKELENKNLLEFEQPIDDFMLFIQELDLVQDQSISSVKRYYDVTRPLTDKEISRLENQSYFLTDLGKEAFDLVVSTVVSQLEPPVSTP